jgi:hypothetical protein
MINHPSALTPRVTITYQGEKDSVSQQRREAEREQREQQRSKDKLIYFIMPRIGTPMQDIEPPSCSPCEPTVQRGQLSPYL